MTLKVGDALKQKHFKKDFEVQQKYNAGTKKPSYLVSVDGTKYLITRQGNCQPKRCGSACCKFFAIGGLGDLGYLSNFVDKSES